MSEKIAGVSSAIAFMLVLMIGIYFDQPADEIMMKSLVALVLFYILGFVFGEASTLVVLEKMERFELADWVNSEGKEMGIRMEHGEIVVVEENTEEEPAEEPAEKTEA